MAKAIVTDKPKFTHDCGNCIFLGTYKGGVFIDSTEKDLYDLYFCQQSGHPTVIARYGNEGSQYQSGMNFARPDGIQPLYQAKLRAIKLGLINTEKQ